MTRSTSAIVSTPMPSPGRRSNLWVAMGESRPSVCWYPKLWTGGTSALDQRRKRRRGWRF